MDLLEALFLDGNVAVKSFCKALFTKTSHRENYIQVNSVYKMLTGECFLSFMLYKYTISTFKGRFPEFQDGTVCPACPKDSGTMILLFDALFGLVRKYSSGKSPYDPVLKDVYFMDQDAVDEFVETYHSKLSSTELQECSDFKAGNTLRSKKMNNKLDETGIFGCSCRHEVPKKFFNLKRGERLANAVYLLTSIVNETSPRVKIIVMYDVACTLVRHLKKRNSDLLCENISYCIPSFYVYGHKADCQLMYSPKSTLGVGLSDGKVMERQWSSNRRFSKITKEQTPSHRADTLSLAMLHYARHSINELGRRLCGRYERAVKTKEATDSELQDILFSVNVTDRSILTKWVEDEKTLEFLPKNDTYSPYEEYAVLLEKIMKLRHKTVDLESNEEEEIRRTENSLQKLERKLGITQRWVTSSLHLKNILLTVNDKRRQHLLRQLHGFVFNKMLLSNLKKRYADGQKIAIKLNKQISSNNKAINRVIESYNAISSLHPSSTMPNELIWRCIVDFDSEFWRGVEQRTSQSNVPSAVRRKCIELYQLNLRSEEEIILVRNEMSNVLSFYGEKIFIYERSLGALGMNVVDMGWRATLKQSIQRYKIIAKELSCNFSKFIDSGGGSEETFEETHLSSDDSDDEDIDFSMM